MSLKNKPLVAVSLLCFLLTAIPKSKAQEALDAYIQEGLKNNLVLQQKHVGLEKAMYSLKIASSYFQPSLDFNASFNHGEGGRAIALPVGDLLNPVYATLNELLQENDFPQIENVNQQFFPQNFVDAHVRASVPLYNRDLYYNHTIQQHEVALQEYEVKIYARELVKDIKTAYFRYLSAAEAVKIYESALSLVKKNVEVNEALLRNGRGLPASVLRAESELETVKAQLHDAQNIKKNARKYFNFLLNREQAMDIRADAEVRNRTDELIVKVDSAAVQARGEVEMLRTVDLINHTLINMKQNFWFPKLNAFADLGAQSENMDWTSRSPYLLVGLSVDIPLYQGRRNHYQIKQAELDLQTNRFNLDHTTQQLQLAVDIALNNLNTAYQNHLAAQKRMKSAESYFRLVERGYQEGTNSLIEFIDARNQLTSAQLHQSISTYKVLEAMAAYERESGTYPLPE
ncbi:outer membrane protein [Catalinimonas alkaloidigena]|uniref:TolC family protein n=1 Tax=Catalinimonas alkaloidigena TaxID=1075417 RepID=UPI0024058F93|nr:TolC family protein [Catalinimonas alkaloidigena]MDF9799614.1 outer membrane protein [Catalinimonas alkaloidigena]